MMHCLFRFEFLGEPALDAGGVAREFFSVICNQIFNPDCGLFLYSAVNQMCMQINPNSGIANEHHLRYLFLFWCFFVFILCMSSFSVSRFLISARCRLVGMENPRVEVSHLSLRILFYRQHSSLFLIPPPHIQIFPHGGSHSG